MSSVANNFQVDGEGLAQQLGLSLSTIPPKFSLIRKRYNLNVKVMNTGGIRRNGNSVGSAMQTIKRQPEVEEDEAHASAASVSSNIQDMSMEID